MLLEKMMAEENQEPNFYPKYRKVLPPGLEVNQVSDSFLFSKSEKIRTDHMSRETDCSLSSSMSKLPSRI